MTKDYAYLTHQQLTTLLKQKLKECYNWNVSDIEFEEDRVKVNLKEEI